ncbi:MAG: hypothetical protein H6Q15_2594, partial [Bacteroidetes bacterium]|nr:hypothetical protein [Bacteroidota bacterium]
MIMKKTNLVIIVIFFVTGLISCNNMKKKSTVPDPLVTDIDSTVRPQDDYFDYANGTWIKK